ncbi:MAG: mechanosensitive ion channel family protein [Janthinobacterium lividum]
MRKVLSLFTPSLLLALALVAWLPLASPAAAASTPPDTLAGAATPDKLRLLLDLVQDPEVRAAIGKAPGVAPPVAGPVPDTMAGGLGTDLERLRDRLGTLAHAVPGLPGQFVHARLMLDDMLGRGDAFSLLYFVPLFMALGFGGEALFRRYMRRFQGWLLALPLQTVNERVTAVFVRLAYGLGIILSFAIGSIGAVLPFEWTSGFKQALLALLLAAVVVRLSNVVGRFLLAPGAPRFRVIPVDMDVAHFLFRRIQIAGILLGLGTQGITLLTAFGFDAVSRDLCIDALGLLLMLLGLETVWRYPSRSNTPSASANDVTFHHAHTDWRHFRARWLRLGASAVLVALWCLAVAQAATPFWILLFAVGGPSAVLVTQRSVRHVLRPTQETTELQANRLEVVFLERGIRTLMIAGGAALLAHLIGLDVAGLAMQDVVATRVARAIIGVIVVVLVSDFLWHVIVAVIDRKLAGTVETGDVSDDGGNAARLQTLLPITKNLSLAALAAVAGTMVLAALGVEIGPLIASAGVVGVAIGFGAQTLVKDIISGIFYLIDDAFRIGEYIQSGTYKGTVESFSLRSVKLRHQRGALYTIPFGSLGAVQNLSRDWVVDKIRLNVRYDTDLEQVRKIIKKIGEQLAVDEELGPGILKPMKLQGVAQFGDYAVQLQTKMTTVPGDVQFASRRRALLLIKEAFHQNGIGFALPTVHVSGEGSDVAAAHSALALVKAAEATAAE